MLSRTSRFREVLQLLRREATPFVRLRIASVLVLVVTTAMLTALGPVALKLIVDDFTGSRHRAATYPLLLVALYVVSQWLARAAGEFRGLIYGRIERRMFRTLSERLFAHLMHLPLRFHLNRRTGAISETLTSGLEGFQLILHHLVFTVLPVTAELTTVLVVLGHLAPPPFLALFCGTLVFYAGAFAYSAATLTHTARTASLARVEAGAAITDGLLNYETVKYFTAEAMVQERVAKALTRSETEWVTFYGLYARNGLAVVSIFALFLAAMIWYATVEVRKQYMTVGDFVLVNTYMLQLVRPIEMLGYAMQGFSQGLAMLDRMLRLFREPPEPLSFSRAGSGTQPATGPGVLEFDHVNLSYRQDFPVLKDISFRIGPKRTLGIVGPSGSGKSTIVRLLMRLLEPDGGNIMLDGVPITDLPIPLLRSAIAVVPQDTILFNDSIAYNIAFGRAAAPLAEIQRAASIAHLHEFILSLPDGYDTVVGERGLKLSGGERQRISIARAVLKCPSVYVFDEATSSLDSPTEQDILDNLREISRSSSTLVIAHRLSTVIHSDEIVVLEQGQISERGTHVSLLRHNARYAKLWHAQQDTSGANIRPGAVQSSLQR